MKSSLLVCIDKECGQGHEESGAILVFLAIALLAIVGLLALAIDSGRLASSDSEQTRTAEATAMAALQAFREASGSYDARLAVAIARAEEVAGLSANALMGRPGESQVSGGELASNAAGEVKAGTYFFREPAETCASFNPANNDANGCPCSGSVSNAPCLRERLASDTEATGFEVTLQTRTGSPIGNFCGSVIGQKDISLSNRGRAAMVPRNGVFAVDLSSSVCGDTHIDPNRAGPGGGSYCAYRVLGTDPPNPSVQNPPCGVGAPPLDNPCLVNGLCRFQDSPREDIDETVSGYQAAPNDLQRLSWESLGDVRGANPTVPTVHYKDDFRCYQLDTNGDGIDETYLIDAFRDPLAGYLGPEPLTSILSGINVAAQIVDDEAIAGDKIAVFGFDKRSDIPQREIGESYPPASGTKPGNANLQRILDMTDVTNPSSFDLRIANHFFFPRPGAHTDLPEAVMKGSAVLRDLSNFSTAQNYVAMFTDGLNTCHHNGPSPNWWEFLRNTSPVSLQNDNCRIGPDPDPGINFCSWQWSANKSWNNHDNGMREAASLVSGDHPFDDNGHLGRMQDLGYPTYVNLGITFHVAAFGDLSQPHTILRRASSGSGCMDDRSARREGKDFVQPMRGPSGWPYPYTTNRLCYETTYGDGPAFGNLRCQYTGHMDYLYNYMVVPTGGYFVPVRPPCDIADVRNSGLIPGFTSGQCTAGILEDLVNTICDTAAPGELVKDPSLAAANIAATDTGIEYTSCSPPDPTVAQVPAGDPEKGHRLRCDLSCQTATDQIQGFVQSIYRQNPYVRVE